MPTAVTKFGVNQIWEKTPIWANVVFRVALYLAAATTIVLSTISEIPDHTKVVIMKYSLEGVTLIHAFSKLFGIQITNDPTQINNTQN